MLATELQFDFFKKQKNDVKPLSKEKKIFLGFVSLIGLLGLCTVVNIFMTSSEIISKITKEEHELRLIERDMSLTDLQKVEKILDKNTLSASVSASVYVMNLEGDLLLPVKERKSIYNYYMKNWAKGLSEKKEKCSNMNLGCNLYAEQFEKMDIRSRAFVADQIIKIEKYEQAHIKYERK